MIKSNGPSMLPCGIPLFTEDFEEYDPLTLIRCFRLLRKSFIRSHIGP